MERPGPGGEALTAPWEGYSLAERDRRWQAVRENTARAGLDGLLVPLGNEQDARYLTQSKVAVVVLPTDGRPPIVIAEPGAANAWVPDPRPPAPDWATPTVAALADLGLARARVGVAGLAAGRLSHGRASDGVANHGLCAALAQSFPNATFADATDIVGFARYVKSDEEIACLRRATAIAEAGIEEMIAAARPGVPETVLYGRVVGRMLALGGQYYPLAMNTRLVTDEREGRRNTSPPLGRVLQEGTLISNEVSCFWGDQLSQEDQPILLGRLPDAWQPLVELQREVFEGGLARMKPGTLFGDFLDWVKSFERESGPSASILLHGRGLGDDGPLLVPDYGGENIRDVPMQNGNAWVWKPIVHSPDRRLMLIWGGDVVVTARGGERLFQRPHGVVAIT